MRNKPLDFNKIYPQKNGGLIKILSKNIDKISTNGLHRWYNVKFLDYDEVLIVSKQSIEKGLIKHPLQKNKILIKDLSKDERKIYNIWVYLKYRNFSLDKHWNFFSNFLNWYKENSYEEENLVLDIYVNKNILNLNEDIYSSYTCLLLPKELHKFFSLDSPFSGIKKQKFGNKYYCIYNDKKLGEFNSIKDAKQIYAKEKYNELINILKKYNIPSKVKAILLQYDFTWNDYFNLSFKEIYNKYIKYTLSSISDEEKARKFEFLMEELLLFI